MFYRSSACRQRVVTLLFLRRCQTWDQQLRDSYISPVITARSEGRSSMIHLWLSWDIQGEAYSWNPFLLYWTRWWLLSSWEQVYSTSHSLESQSIMEPDIFLLLLHPPCLFAPRPLLLFLAYQLRSIHLHPLTKRSPYLHNPWRTRKLQVQWVPSPRFTFSSDWYRYLLS